MILLNNLYFLGIGVEIWALIISFFALFFSVLKDFILPWFFKPIMKFKYDEKRPFRRENTQIISTSISTTDASTGVNIPNNQTGCFIRFQVKNEGRRPALNCRCQIFSIKKDNKIFGDFLGFPLKWASRPEAIASQLTGERLNIAIGETEFVDLLVTVESSNSIFFQKYHSIPIGISNVLEPGKYELNLIFSGDNFKPHYLNFQIEKPNNQNSAEIQVSYLE